MDQGQLNYYQKREQQALALAARALDPSIARIHTAMATAYGQQALAPRTLIAEPNCG